MTDGSPAASDGHSFKNLGDQDEYRDEQSGEELADRRSRDQGDGHGKLHGHAAFHDVREASLKIGKPPTRIPVSATRSSR